MSDLLAYGGASKLIYDLLPRMKKSGHDCELLILTDDHSKYVDDLREKGVSVHVVPKNIHGHYAKIKYIKGWIEKKHYDILHANLFPMTYYCSIIKRMLGKRCPILVMTEHSTDNKRRHKSYLRPLEQYIYKKYDYVISISEKTQENLCRWLGTEGSSRFSVVENGIDVDIFRNAEPLNRQELCKDYREGDILLLTVGSFTPQKNHEKLLEALALMPEQYMLLLCGEGPLESEIREKVEEYNLEKRVVFLGFRKDVARIMHSADILVIPSLWEGFGLIAVEGMACGLPLVASDVPGLSDIVGEVGTRFSPKDPDSIKEAINRTVLDIKNPGIKKQLLERAKQYDINETTSRYLCIYKSLIN